MSPLRFALLEHQTAGHVHWDLLVQVPGRERLATWRLLANPLRTDATIGAERIADHRPLYLDYEGPISGDRGTVRRIDAGTVQWVEQHDDEAVLELRGEHLRGRYVVRRYDQALQFVRASVD